MARNLDIRYEILKIFKKQPTGLFSTDFIVRSIYPKEYALIDKALNSSFSDKTQITKAKLKRGKLHRKVLHHLGRLVSEEIIEIGKTGNRGHKYFSLNLEHGSIVEISQKNKKIIISKPNIPAMPIERLEKEKIIFLHEQSTLLDRINSILIDCERLDPIKYFKIAKNSFSVINDCICLYNFKDFRDFSYDMIPKLDKEAGNFGRKISIVINLRNLDIDGVQKLIEQKLKNIDLVFEMDAKSINSSPNKIKKLIKILIDNRIDLTIRNSDIGTAPYFRGINGPFSIEEKDWNKYQKQKDTKIIAVSQSTIIVDVFKFFTRYDAKDFTNLIERTCKTLLYTNSLMRQNPNDTLKKMSINLSDTFMTARNYIRFWNYGLKQPTINKEDVLNLIMDAKKQVRKFYSTEETIYKSCGMPMRFRIAMSCQTGHDLPLSSRVFRRNIIKNTSDLTNIKSHLKDKEQLSEIFDGGDIARFHRSSPDIDDVFREIGMILATYKIPFFSIVFKKAFEGDTKLTEFM